MKRIKLPWLTRPEMNSFVDATRVLISSKLDADGIAIHSASHTIGIAPSCWVTGSLSESCFETIYKHTIVRGGKDVSFYYRTDEEYWPRLKYALQHGERRLNISLNPGSSSGKTADFEPASVGSNPTPGTK